VFGDFFLLIAIFSPIDLTVFLRILCVLFVHRRGGQAGGMLIRVGVFFFQWFIPLAFFRGGFFLCSRGKGIRLPGALKGRRFGSPFLSLLGGM